MKKLVVLGVIALMFLGVGRMAHAYVVSIYVSNGTSGAEVDFGDCSDNSADCPWLSPPSCAYVSACAVDNTASRPGDQTAVFSLIHPCSTPWDFYVWNVGMTAPVTLYAFLQDDGGGLYGGSYCPSRRITGANHSAVCRPVWFEQLANTPTDPGAVALGTITAGSSRAQAEHYQIFVCLVPEPSSIIALLCGIGGLCGAARGRRL